MTKKIKFDKIKENLKTFSVHETNLTFVRHATKAIFAYKHLENILNILLNQQINQNLNNELNIENNYKDYEIFNLLLNPVIMKAVLSYNSGGIKTQDNIIKINNYYKGNDLFEQLKLAAKELNSHNISMIVRRLSKDWSNAFANRKLYYANPASFTGEPQFPQPKKLSKVFNYSIPLAQEKFTLKKLHTKKLLGINFYKNMQYTYIGSNQYITSKTINNITVSYSHGHIYYEFTYVDNSKDNKTLNKSLDNFINNKHKQAGLDIGINNLLSLFIHDQTTQSLIFSGKSLISYNCHFNKKLAQLNTLISYEVKTYKLVQSKIKDKNTDKYLEFSVPESYTNKGKNLINKRDNLHERRGMFMEDYMQKLSKKIIQYLIKYDVTSLVLSKNLSFTKTNGNIKMGKKDKQKFYQIPFGRLLNLIEEKAEGKGINIVLINEAYTSKTSSLTANVVNVQNKAINKQSIIPNDLNGNRGVKAKGKLVNKLGRGLFKDNILNKVINSDLNAALNHIKVANPNLNFNFSNNNNINGKILWKLCNPIKIKSNHEFDKILKLIKLR